MLEKSVKTLGHSSNLASKHANTLYRLYEHIHPHIFLYVYKVMQTHVSQPASGAEPFRAWLTKKKIKKNHFRILRGQQRRQFEWKPE